MKKRLLSKIPVQIADANIIFSAKRLQENSIDYIICGKAEKVSDENILQLLFYKKNDILQDMVTPEFRLFLSENDYITQMLNCKPAKWLTGALESILPQYINDRNYEYWNERSFIADEETWSAIEQFLGFRYETPFSCINDYQDEIKKKRLRKKHQVIKDRIDEKMRLIGDIPDDFAEWIDTTGFGDKRYLFYRYKNAKKKQGYCTICKSSVSVEKPKHNRYGVCPNCGGNVMFKVEGKSKRLCDKKYISLFQKTPEGFVVRYFSVHREYKDLKSLKFSIFETNRDFYENGKMDMYIYNSFKQTNEIRWCETNYPFGYQPSYAHYQHGYGSQSVVYEKNLSDVITDTEYRYSALKEYATCYPGAAVYVYDYLESYKKYPYIEYITKLRLYNLVEDIIRHYYTPAVKINSLADLFGNIGKQNLKIMQEIDGGRNELELMQKLSEAHIPFDADYLRWYKKAFGYNTIAIDYAGYASLERIQKYCSQYVSKSGDFLSIFTYWKDYINACEKLDYDLTNDFVLFPRELKQAHDLAYKRVEQLKKKGRKQLLNNMTKRLAGYLAELKEKYSFENNEYAVVVPQNLNDIVKEGHALHHCVGSYAERFGDRKTVVLFVRNKSNMKKPFYTMEIFGGRMSQCRGKMNCAMTAEVKSFVDLFEKRILSEKNNRNFAAG